MCRARSSSSPPAPVVVVGAGLTGMSAALELGERGVPVRVFERLDRVGGHVVTDEERGFRFDRTGHLLHIPEGPLQERVLGWLGGQCRRIERRSVVWSHGAYTRYPYQANAHGLPPRVAYECVMGFIDAQRAAPGVITDFEAFCRAKFGTGISEHFMIPYNTRVWGVAPSEISADWCDRFVPVPTLEQVLAGAVGLVGPELGYHARFLYPPRGIGVLSEAMAAAVGCVELDRELQAIDTRARELQFRDERVPYEVLISTAPLPVLVQSCSDVPREVHAAAGELRCSHLYYLDVALRTPCGQPYHWVYIPEDKYPFYRVGCYSHFSPAMAPPGHACLYVELVDRRRPELGQIMPQVANGLIEMGIIDRPEAVLFARLRHLTHAYVIFDHAYRTARARVQDFLRSRGIISTGRYGGWNYSSMGDALRFGIDAADQAIRWLSAGEIASARGGAASTGED